MPDSIREQGNKQAAFLLKLASKNPKILPISVRPIGMAMLFLRLRKYKENELLFLHDMGVPANNSLCERLARLYKRKQKQAVTLRSYENLCCICDGLSVIYLLRSQGENVYQKISEIYGRRRPTKAGREAGVKV